MENFISKFFGVMVFSILWIVLFNIINIMMINKEDRINITIPWIVAWGIVILLIITPIFKNITRDKKNKKLNDGR